MEENNSQPQEEEKKEVGNESELDNLKNVLDKADQEAENLSIESKEDIVEEEEEFLGVSPEEKEQDSVKESAIEEPQPASEILESVSEDAQNVAAEEVAETPKEVQGEPKENIEPQEGKEEKLDQELTEEKEAILQQDRQKDTHETKLSFNENVDKLDQMIKDFSKKEE
ncbi:MAG: hypothetical protein PHY73_00545 [Candidatus Omnitrophica bacterium]|nr:hypothetical protein [Candidatus Omnitrophota bacterium]